MLMVGRFKRKGVKTISLTRSQDPDLYPVCIRRDTSPNPNRTPHVTRPFNIYKEGQGSPKRDKLQARRTISRARNKEPAYRRLPRDDNET